MIVIDKSFVKHFFLGKPSASTKLLLFPDLQRLERNPNHRPAAPWRSNLHGGQTLLGNLFVNQSGVNPETFRGSLNGQIRSVLDGFHRVSLGSDVN
jgi:hypothetical protein